MIGARKQVIGEILMILKNQAKNLRETAYNQPVDLPARRCHRPYLINNATLLYGSVIVL